ncbi:MAG: Stk1 family PASTA domain-containing Ser/Thr kinase [Roseburia inulinivorans]|nr:Stk1 family PASTA domain-containing Ser/Thr kinase [Roseburia inulinivorans]
MLTEGMFVGDRYEIVNKIGTGGMSDVYKAKDHTLGRFVAIKVLKPEFSEDVNFVTKFRTEAQSAAGLEHPNIVNIYDVGSENGMHYIVMEYVEGITLKTYIEKKGQLTFKEAVSIAIQVGRGIEAAHNKGIIHRDIKPQNIIISTEGKVKVTDFGIARAATSNTISSDVMGSVHYASPEQARNGFVDGKSDIYSLGIVMYEMVTGRVPFDGDTTVAVAIQHLQEEIVPPSAYAPNLPISMEKIILKCTQKNPDRRYESMTALLADLRKALISPNEDFVVIAPVSQEKTRVIGEEEINKIKQETSNIYLSDEDVVSHNQNHRDKFEKRDRFEEDDEDDEEAYDDDDLEEMNPKMDKAITIMGIAAGVIIVALIIFILVSFFGDFKFGGSSNKANTETSETQTDGIEVPDLKGLTFDEAKEQLNAKGLGIKKNAGTVASDQYDEGQIVSQTPDALTKAEANTTVEVTLSSGKGEVSVPSVTGMDETTAYNTLTNSGFTPVKDYAYSADVAQGNVIEQSPNAGSLAKSGDNVKIVISRGKEQAEATSVAVPGVTGLTEDAARSAIQNVGLAVGNVSSAYSDSVASGQIISQSPVVDTAVDAGTAVDFVVSMGAEPAQEVKPTTYKINLNIKKPNNESVAAANIYLYDGADGTGNILEQWTNQSISLFGEDGLSISKSGMLASSGSLKIDWLGADGQQLGSSQIVSPISFKAE